MTLLFWASPHIERLTRDEDPLDGNVSAALDGAVDSGRQAEQRIPIAVLLVRKQSAPDDNHHHVVHHDGAPKAVRHRSGRMEVRLNKHKSGRPFTDRQKKKKRRMTGMMRSNQADNKAGGTDSFLCVGYFVYLERETLPGTDNQESHKWFELKGVGNQIRKKERKDWWSLLCNNSSLSYRSLFFFSHSFLVK